MHHEHCMPAPIRQSTVTVYAEYYKQTMQLINMCIAHGLPLGLWEFCGNFDRIWYSENNGQ